MDMECIFVYDRFFICGYVNDLTFIWVKDICQSDSHLSRLLRSSWSLMQSEEL